MRSFLQHYGMLLVLLLLAACFSVMTLSDQPVEGAPAGESLALSLPGDAGPVLIATGASPSDPAFAEAAKQGLAKRGIAVAAVAEGEPKDSRAALQELVGKGTRVGTILVSQSAAQWLVFADAAADFPVLGKPVLVQPRSQRWPTFLKRDNLVNIANQIAVIAIVAIGMTLVIITGGIDLSVGSLVAFSAVVTTLLIRDYGGAAQASPAAMVMASLGGMLLCGAAGTLNGWLVTRWSLPPFIVTLVMMLVASGAAYLLAAGQSIYQVPDSFVWLGRGTGLAGLPNAVVLMLLLFAIAHLLMKHTAMGRYLYAVGGSREAALVSGLNVSGVLIFAYALCGLLAGLGGVIMASQLRSGSPTYGQMYELYVIAAAVVGGTSLSGGRGKMFGTLTGALIIAVIQNGMNLMNIESYTQKVVLGLVILGAVLVDQAGKK